MFIFFEFLTQSHEVEKIELAVSGLQQAKSMCVFLEKSNDVLAWKISGTTIKELGFSKRSMTKLKESF
jgi:hypothetical protein